MKEKKFGGEIRRFWLENNPSASNMMMAFGLSKRYFRNWDMTQDYSKFSSGALVEKFIEYQDLQRLAVWRDDIPAANKHIEKVWAVIDALAATPEGRGKLERLLSHPAPYLRLRAAEEVIKWAPDKAVPVFGHLLVEGLGKEISAAERIDIRITAGDWLYKHFNIRSWDRNDLIEPLKAYGVELSHRDHTKWR